MANNLDPKLHRIREHSASPTLAKFPADSLGVLKTHLCAVGAELDSLSVLALPSQPTSSDFPVVGNRSAPLLSETKTLPKESGKAPKALEEAIATGTSIGAASGSASSSGDHTSAAVNAVLLDGRDGNWLPTTIQSADLLLPPAAVATMSRPDDVIATEEGRNYCSTDSEQQKETVQSLYYKHAHPEGRGTGQYRSNPAAEGRDTSKSLPFRPQAPPFRRRPSQNFFQFSTAPSQRPPLSPPGHRAASLMRSSARSTTVLIGREPAQSQAAKLPALARLVNKPRSLLFVVTVAVFSVLSFYCSYAVATFFMQNSLTRTDIPAAGEGLTIAPVGEGAIFSRAVDRDERIAARGAELHAYAVQPRKDVALIRDKRKSRRAKQVSRPTKKNLST